MSKTPWWVGPSSPTRPARSIAKTTLSFCRQTSWTIWSNAPLQERRVDRGDRLGPLEREAAAKRIACCSAMPTSK
jgi:hypothetical protein